MIDTKTAKALERHGRNVRRATDLRDEAIVDAVDSGASLREVGEAVGMSHMGVSAIVKREKAGR